jgi:Uma2 family endonuclease
MAGVPEAWLVDIPAGILDVHRRPGEEGYEEVRTARRGERVWPLAFPDVTLRVEDILG